MYIFFNFNFLFKMLYSCLIFKSSLQINSSLFKYFFSDIMEMKMKETLNDAKKKEVMKLV